MTQTQVRTPTASWRRNEDGSWDLDRVPTLGRGRGGGDNPGGGSGFLTPDEVHGGDNIVITQLPGDSLLIERGGHMVLFEGVPTAWRRNLDFQGPGVNVVDDPGAERTVVTIGGPGTGGMIFRGAYDAGTLYSPGDVVTYGDGLFIFNAGPQGFGFGFGPFGEGPFGGTGSVSGFGADPFGDGPFGG